MRGILLLGVLSGCDLLFGLDVLAPPDAGVQLPPGPWSSVAAGEGHSCVIDLDGAMWCWGRNDNGQLGLPKEVASAPSPTRINGAWKRVAAYGATTCAIATDDTLWCWGNNDTGNVGDGTMLDRFTPAQIATGAWLDVAVGGGHACALDSAGFAWCWGANDTGQTGTGAASINVLKPKRIDGFTWSSLVAGLQHTCALAPDRVAYCWGSNYEGQLGTGKQSSSYEVMPVPVSLHHWTVLAAGRGHTCGVLDNGSLRCWGSNGAGQLGDPAISLSLTPSPVTQDTRDWVALSLGGSHTCATKQDDSLWCWGNNSAGQRGGLPFAANNPVPYRVAGGARHWQSIAAGDHHTCAIGDEHNLWCFGGELGNGASVRMPVQVDGSWRAVAAGSSTTCAIDTSDHLACWGANDSGQLGDGTRVSHPTPTYVSDATWQQIDVHNSRTCALDTAGQLWCWGYAYYGLGDGTINRIDPTPIGTQRFAKLSGGELTVAAIEAGTGALFCWGHDYNGQCGLGPGEPRPTPAQIGTDAWTEVTLGSYHGCGVTVAGSVQCWGDNSYGELGNGTKSPATMPSQITDQSARNLSAGVDHTCSVTSGAGECWGNNLNGQIGAGTTTTSYLTPSRVAGTWAQMSAGLNFTCAISGDHALWCWGDNRRGQLGGDTDVTMQTSPMQVGDSLRWTAVSTGESHACGVRDDASLWCWGNNDSGQLGIGETDNDGKPVLITPP